MSKFTGVGAFFVSFIVTPFASNASEASTNRTHARLTHDTTRITIILHSAHLARSRITFPCPFFSRHCALTSNPSPIQLVSSINFAKKKKKRNISLTYCQVLSTMMPHAHTHACSHKHISHSPSCCSMPERDRAQAVP